MEYKYKDENIQNTIATAISKNKKQNKKDGISYNEVYRGVVSLLRHPLSRRQFNKHVGNMEHEKLLSRHDPTRKRGCRVLLSLTEKGKRKYDLKILGEGEGVQRQKRLYGLLIFFEVCKRGSLLTERQLSRLLESIGSINDFKSSQELIRTYRVLGTFYKSIKGVEILGIPSYDRRTKSTKIWYYTVIPGFSVEEFVAYQKALKSGREPRPLSNSRTLIPFALSESYTKKEVKEAIVLFEESGFLELIESVFPGEKRYNVADRSLRALVRATWMVSTIDYELLGRRLLFNKSTDRDREYLEVYVGQGFADKIIASAHHIRRLKKEEWHIEEEQAIRDIEAYGKLLIQEIMRRFAKVIQENEILRDIVEKFIFLPSRFN